MGTGVQPTVPAGVPTLHRDRVQQSGIEYRLSLSCSCHDVTSSSKKQTASLVGKRTDTEAKKWVEVPSTCQQNNYDTCRDVQKQKLVQVTKDALQL